MIVSLFGSATGPRADERHACRPAFEQARVGRRLDAL
jgi:hypothetical protein